MSIPIPLPDPLRPAVEGCTWTAATEGRAGGSVFRLDRPDCPALFLKHGTGHVAADITAEKVRLDWLAGRLPAPAVLHFNRSLDEAWLLTAAVAGQSAHAWLQQHPDRRTETVAALARFLRTLHALPPAECPFAADHAARLAEARRNIDAGRVDADDFDEERAGRTAEEVWDEMMGLLSLPFDAVVTHGDFTLDNVLIADGRVTGCIDLGRLGVADPYQDLAILWRDLAEFGADAQAELWRACGLAQPDARKIRFHLCLDEFF